MERVIACLLVLGGVACSSSTTGTDEGGGGCADVTGNYEVAVTKVSGSCGEGDNKASLTIGRDDSGLYILLPGVEGGCPASLDAATCKFQAECKIVNAKNPSDTWATYNVTYTFSGSKFSGSLVGALGPPIVTTACDSTVKHEGTRL